MLKEKINCDKFNEINNFVLGYLEKIANKLTNRKERENIKDYLKRK